MLINRSVVALLLIALPYTVKAVEIDAHPLDGPVPHTSKKAERVIDYLDRLGAAAPGMQATVRAIDARLDDDYLRLSETEMPGGTLTLRYRVDSGVGLDQLELRYAPQNSEWDCIANTDGVMLRYRLTY